MKTRPLPEGAVLVPVALGIMLAPLNSTMIAVAIPDLLRDFDRSLAWGSWIVTSYLVAMAAVQPLGGALGDRYGRRRLFLIGLTLFLAATVVAALSWHIEVLIVARTVQAVSGAAAIPNGTALVRSLVAPERRGRAFGAIGSAVALAAGAGLALVRHSERSPNPVLNLALLRARGFTPAVATILLSNLSMYTLLLSLPLFLTGWDLWNSAQVGLLLAGLSLPTIVFSPLGGRLSDSIGRRAPAFVGTALISLGALPFLAISPNWSWPLYLIPLVLIGAGLGLSMAPVQTTAIETAPSAQSGQAAGLFSTMRYLGSIVGSSIMAAVLIGAAPPVGNFRILYAVLFLSACGAVLAAWSLPTWLDKARDHEAEPYSVMQWYWTSD